MSLSQCLSPTRVWCCCIVPNLSTARCYPVNLACAERWQDRLKTSSLGSPSQSFIMISNSHCFEVFFASPTSSCMQCFYTYGFLASWACERGKKWSSLTLNGGPWVLVRISVFMLGHVFFVLVNKVLLHCCVADKKCISVWENWYFLVLRKFAGTFECHWLCLFQHHILSYTNCLSSWVKL